MKKILKTLIKKGVKVFKKVVKKLVKYMNESKTRTDRMFYKNEIDYIETLIENMRKELKLY